MGNGKVAIAWGIDFPRYFPILMLISLRGLWPNQRPLAPFANAVSFLITNPGPSLLALWPRQRPSSSLLHSLIPLHSKKVYNFIFRFRCFLLFPILFGYLLFLSFFSRFQLSFFVSTHFGLSLSLLHLHFHYHHFIFWFDSILLIFYFSHLILFHSLFSFLSFTRASCIFSYPPAISL